MRQEVGQTSKIEGHDGGVTDQEHLIYWPWVDWHVTLAGNKKLTACPGELNSLSGF